MRLHASSAAWLMPLVLTVLLTACDSSQKQLPPQKFAPPVSTVPKPPVLHPQLPQTALVLPEEPLDTDTDAILEEAAKPALRRRRPPAKPAPEVPDNAQPPATSASAANDSTEVPAIGDLSSGGAVSGGATDIRRETADSITDTERGLKTLGRPLNGQEQKTAAQIRQFIRQARKALTSGDVDGAFTLAAKAKVLLGELSE
jgi:hypothetical protein